MKKLLIASAALALVFATSCKKEKWPFRVKANGNITEETRILSNVQEVDFNLSGNLYITHDPEIGTPEIRIKTSENVMELIKTEVKGGKLKIEDDNCIRKLKEFNAYLTVNDLDAVLVNGSGDVKSLSTIAVDRLRLSINGSGDMDFDVATNVLNTDISGSGDIKVEGQSEDIYVDINGSGDIHAFGCEAHYGSISINGSGDVQINATRELDVNISGSGDVIYDGSPRLFINSSGSGSVTSR